MKGLARANPFFLVRPAWTYSGGCKSHRKLITANEVDRELARRGHRFVRSRRAGEGMLASPTELYDRLHLKVNDANRDRRTTTDLGAGLKGLLPACADTQGVPRTRRVNQAPATCDATQSLASGHNDVLGELKAMGSSDDDARKVAGNSRCWWPNSRIRSNRATPIAYFDRRGVPRLS